MFLHLQNAIHVTLYIIGRAFISSSSKKTMCSKMSSVHGSSVLTVTSRLVNNPYVLIGIMGFGYYRNTGITCNIQFDSEAVRIKETSCNEC